MTKRVLVTGSRAWLDYGVIKRVMVDLQKSLGAYTLVSGHFPTGADALAEEAARELGIEIEAHPAKWKQHSEFCPPHHATQDICKAAGFRRNKVMVDLGADVCIAFIRNNSSGASMTADLAKKAGIDTRIWNI